jgi:hypothetical protein
MPAVLPMPMKRSTGRCDVKSLHAMQRWLERQRRETERTLGHKQIGVASCEVLDWLIRRTRVVTDQVPADAPITRSYIENQMGDAVEALRSISTTLTRMAELMQQCEEIVYQQRQPFIRVIDCIEAEGYRVDTATFTTVTDAMDWSIVDTTGDPTLRVQLAAEKIARAEQATVYQQRLQRMDAAIRQIDPLLLNNSAT